MLLDETKEIKSGLPKVRKGTKRNERERKGTKRRCKVPPKSLSRVQKRILINFPIDVDDAVISAQWL